MLHGPNLVAASLLFLGLTAMVSSTSRRLPLNVEQLAAEAIRQGRIKRRDHLKLTAIMLSSSNLTPAERQNINQVFDLVRAGRVQLID